MKKSKIFFLFLIVATLILGIGVTALARVSINGPIAWDEGSSCKHSKTETETTSAATCTKTGTSVTKCKLCGKIVRNNVLKKKSHSYTNWKYDSSTHWKVCSSCGQKNYDTIKLHSYENGSCKDCRMAEPKCTTSELLFSHTNSWKYKFENTTAETHDVTITCTICNVSKKNTKVRHTFANGSGACPCGWPKDTDTSVCNATNTVSGHKNFHTVSYKIRYDDDEELESSYHTESWKCSKCNKRWTKDWVSHDFKSGKCECGYQKPSSVGNCNNGHRFTSAGVCKICHVQLRVTGGSYSNWSTWSSYSPYNSEPSWQSSVTITFNYTPYNENGKLVGGTMSCTSFTRHNATWHSNVAKKYKLNESSYTTHLSRGGAIGGTSSVNGSTSGNTITFSGIPRGRCYTDVNLDGIAVSIPSRRYTSGGNDSEDPGPKDDDTPKTYVVVVRHRDLTTNQELSNSQKTVNEGGSATAYKENFDGYSYSYVEYPAGNRKYTDSVTITDIREDKEITFWYSRALTVSVIHYDRSVGRTLTTKTYSSPNDFAYNGSLSVSRLTDSTLKAYGTDYTYTNEFTVSTNGATSERKTGDGTTLSNITSSITVTFYYSKPAYVQVVGRVNSAPYEKLYSNELEKVEITPSGVNKTYTARKVDTYECVGYTVEDTLNSNIDGLIGNMKDGNSVSVTLTATETVKLITFLYKPTSGVNVKHVQVGPEKEGDGYKAKILDEELISAKPGETISVDNKLITKEGLLNYTIITVDGKDKDLQSGIEYTKTKYTEKITTEKDKITEVIIYYVSPKVEIEHRFEDKDGNIKNSEKSEEKLDREKDIPSKNLKGKDYVNKEAIVDGEVVEKVPPTPPTLKGTYTVSVKPDSPDNKNVVMIYVYQKQPDGGNTPSDDDEDSEYTPVTCDPTVGNSNVLVDSNVTIVIPNHGVHTDFGEDAYYNKLFAKQKLVKFPFEVYYNGELKAKDTWIEVANRNDISREGNNDGKYEIGIPAWIEKGKYTVDVRVVATGGTEANEREQSNDIFNNGAIAYNEVEINVVGKIYDFTITNLEGDTVWSKYLFENQNKEYKTSTLPIGQANVVPTSYKYGMKLGSTFLYSINTLGVSNTKVQILPKVYYVEKNGGTAVDVTNKLQYKTEKGFVNFDSTAVSLSTKINKQTRMTAEVRNEVSKSMAMKAFVGYGQDTNASRKFGTYNKLLIDNSLRLPYVGYVSTLTKSSDKNFDKVMTSASHWYAEYKLPNTLAMKENSGDDKTVRKDGFYVVCFKIESKDTNGNTYLKYENQYVGNQWKNEGGAESTLTIRLPLTAQASNATTSINVTDGYYPVAIYQANISVSEDYEISGTH